MATLRLTASSYQLSNTSYTNISNPANMYTDVDSTTYATFNHTRNQTTSYYLYIRGFDLTQIPDDAIISNVTVKVKASVSGAGSYTPGLYNNTSSLSKSFNGSIGTSATTRTVDITSNWSTYKTYGKNLTIRLQLNRSSRNTASKMYVYGAEITVEYTLPVSHNIYVTENNCTVTPNGTISVEEGEDLVFKIHSDTKPTITDNGVDVSNSLVEKTGSLGYSVSTAPGASYGFNLNSSGYYESTNKGRASTTSLCVVSMDLPVSCTVKFKVINYAESTYDFGLLSNIDTTLTTSSSADSSNVFWNGKYNNDKYEQVVDYGTVSAGVHTIYVKYFKDSYTDSYNDSLQFKVEIIPNEELTNNIYYEYTLNNIVSDHNIIVTAIIVEERLYLKINGIWNSVGEVYKKVNNVWVKQSNLSTLFDENVNYIKG